MDGIQPRQPVLLIHGIRDIARWQAEIAATLESAGFAVELTNYGRMNLIEFLLPIPFFRSRALEKVWTQLQHAVMLHPNAKISIIAHSFGTYIVANILRRQFNLSVDRVIFCGSAVRSDFPFEQINERFNSPILNEVGTADPWPAVAESLTTGYGSAGTYGFRRPGVKDRFHNGVSHGFFLNAGFCEKYWVPFLKNGTIVPGDLPAEYPPLWVRLISIFKLKYFITAVAIVLLAFAILRLGKPGQAITQQCYRFNAQSGEQSNSLGLRTCFPGKVVYVKYWDPTDYAGLAKERDPTSSPSSWPIDRPNRVFQARGLTSDGHMQWVEQNLTGINNRLENWGAENHYWVTVIENTGIGRGMTGFVLRRVDLQPIPLGHGKTQCDSDENKRDVFEFAIPQDVISRISAGTKPTVGFRRVRVSCAQEVGFNPLVGPDYTDTEMPIVSAESD